jgi:hypothetical protein
MKRLVAILAVPALISSTASSSWADAPTEEALSPKMAEFCAQIERNDVIAKLQKRAEQRQALVAVQEQSSKDFEKLVGKAKVVAYTSTSLSSVGAVTASLIPGVAAYILPLGKATGVGLALSAVAVPTVYHAEKYLARTADRRDANLDHFKKSLEDRLEDIQEPTEWSTFLDDSARIPNLIVSKFGEARRHAGNDYERFLNTLRDPKTGEIRSRWYSFGHDDRRYIEGLAADARTQLELTQLEVATLQGLAGSIQLDCRL